MLTELKIKQAKAKEKPYRLCDDRGLYLRVDPNGKKYWILRHSRNSTGHILPTQFRFLSSSTANSALVIRHSCLKI
ncbi:MAG: Arm DNA-binding domain-containing protein [Fretibacterium sp.]|nr:Arm DNA-binding domain-containing protein [Fretibacterium sp.]